MKRLSYVCLSVCIGAASVLGWACSGFSGSIGDEGVIADASDTDDGTLVTSLEAGSPFDATLDGAATTCNDASSPPSDPHNCGTCGHDCMGGACKAGICGAAVLGAGLNHPQAIANAGSTIYVTENALAGNLYAFQKDGGGVVSAYMGDHLGGVAATQNAVYFAAMDANEVHIAGDIASTSFVGPHVIVADDAGIGVVTSGIEFSLSDPNIEAGLPILYVYGVTLIAAAMDDTDLYMTSSAAAAVRPIVRAGRVTQTATASGVTFLYPTSIVSVGANVYFIEAGNLQVLSLAKSTFATVAPASPIATNLTAPTLLAADDAALYLVDADSIWRIDLVTHQKTLLLSNTPNITALSVDANSIYFVAQGPGDAGTPEDAGFLARLTK